MTRTLQILLTAVVLSAMSVALMVVSLVGLHYYSNKIDRVTFTNCVAIEDLKEGQREAAQAQIAGDLAFLDAHPGGTADFPEAVVRADIAAKQRTVDRFAAKKCM